MKLLQLAISVLVIGVVFCQAEAGPRFHEEGSWKPWMNIRLPGNLLPIEYDVELRPILDENEEGMYLFIGSSTVIFQCKEATRYIFLHSIKLNYTREQVTLRDADDGVLPIEDFFFYEKTNFVVVVIAEPCTQQKVYKLSVRDFVGKLEGMSGMYKSEYKARNGEKRIIVGSQMQPTGARETFPCFDEPALKAEFTVTLWYKANTGYFALSNMLPETYNEKVIDGVLWKSTTFYESVRMSTYLIALVVCDFSYVETYSESGVQTRAYARNETIENGEANYVAKIVAKLLDFYEEYFSVKYALQKSDQVALPDFSPGAMENWGLVIYRESAFVYDKRTTSVSDFLTVAIFASHELAHMWFGNLVSPAWWDDIWLNEGFATYMSGIGIQNIHPKWQTEERFVVEDLHVAFKADGLATSHPLVQPVASPDEIMSQFDWISYYKGASIVRMTNAFIGEENFVNGLTKYLTDLAYEAATHGDLFSHWEKQVNATGLELPVRLTKILETWTLQMGFPIVNVRKQPGKSYYNVTQDYFLLDSTATRIHTPGSKIYGYKWYIPFTYKKHTKLADKRMKRIWLKPEVPELIIRESGYILANINALGYYRVNYDDDTWMQLSNILKSGTLGDISIQNRAQLLEDAFAISSSGRLDIKIALEVSLYLKHEDEYVPWQAFSNNIHFLDEMLGRSHLYGMFSEYVLDLISPALYNNETWEDTDKRDSAVVERLKKRLAVKIACRYGNEHCIARAKKMFAKWRKNPNTRRIGPTFRTYVYCAAIRYGSVEDWDFAWQQLSATTNAQERDDLRYGLACSREPWVISRYIGYCLDPELIRPSNALGSCLLYISKHEHGRDIVWSYISENWDSLLRLSSGDPSFSDIITTSTARFSTDHELEMLESFKETDKDLSSAARAVDQAIETTKFGIHWRQRNEKKFEEWLQMYHVWSEASVKIPR